MALGTVLQIVTALALLADSTAVVESDRFTNSTKISFNGEHVPFGDPAVVVGWSSAEPKSFSLLLLRGSKEWRYLQCHSIHWLVDDKPLDAGKVTHVGDVGRGYVMETMLISSSPEVMEPFASANKVEYKLCNDEFVMRNNDLQGIKDVLAAIKIEQAKAE